VETSFGNWIKRRRKALDLTQEQLAQRVGCSTSAIFKIEADERRPSRQIAELLAQHLEIPADQHALFLKIARQEKGIANLEEVKPIADFVPVPEQTLPKSSLPVFPTRFVGREHEIEIVTSQMHDPACRLLTLTGPGGVGKTRLAVETARRLEDHFLDGVVFLPMAAVNQDASIIPVLADALGIVFSGPADPVYQVIHALRNKRMLLVLDNMEHLVAGSAILGEILQQAQEIKLLLTSREPMHLQWEWVFDVQGLPVPENASVDVLETNSAALLFLQRASQAGHRFYLDPGEAEALVRICQSVDGLPLAIELAASWVRALSFQEIAGELERDKSLLETSMQDLPARHRSIKAVIDHSWDLLTIDEQIVLMRLSVFSGGFTRQAAESIAGASLALLSALVGKSLLRYGKKDGRYDFHELIRQYASTKLLSYPDEAEKTLEAHAHYYSAWIAGLEVALKSTNQAKTAAQIHTETANWLSAWHWLVDHGQLDLLRKMISCLAWYFEIHGYYDEALSLSQSTVARLRKMGFPGCMTDHPEKSFYASILIQSAWFLFRTGNVEQATALFRESDILMRDSSDLETLFYLHSNWGYLSMQNGDIPEAKRLNEKSLLYARQLNSPWHIVIPITTLGVVEYQQGNLQAAYQQLSDSVDIWREVGDPRGLVYSMLYLSMAAFALGLYDTVVDIVHQSNRLALEKMDRWAQAFGLSLHGQVMLAKGEYQSARELFEQSLAVSGEIGDKWACAQATIFLGETLSALGAVDDAKRLFHQAYREAQKAKWAPTLLEAMLGFLLVTQEAPPETRLTYTLSILSHPAGSPTFYRRAERLRDDLSSSLDATQIEAARDAAARRAPEEWDHLFSYFPSRYR
jgi:predicted ATPase/transcriptional regulator with XRE-family HTH domain